ncbi:MAG: metallophosphoesterase [Clostridia bacterium]
MSIYAISDLHLSFSSNKPMDFFGGAWKNHEEEIKANWLAEVAPEDFVILPGDHSWALHTEEAAADLRFLHELPGTKILLKGNHDLWWSTSRKMEEWKERHGLFSLRFLYNDSIAVRSAGKIHAIAGTRGWLCPGDGEYKAQTDEKIYLREAGRLRASLQKADKILSAASPEERGETIVFLHYPPYNLQKDTLFTEAIEERQIKNCYYGHIHGFTDRDRAEARRTNSRLHENGTCYTLVSCDYTANHLIKVME